jgi:hypothetical protein
VVRRNCERVSRVVNATATSGVQGSAGSSNSTDYLQEKARQEFLAENEPSG